MARIEFKPNPAAAANGIKFPGGGNVSASLQTLQDPGNNSLPIAVSNSAVTFGTGTITSNGVVTVKSNGGNIASFRNSLNVERIAIESDGTLRSVGNINAAIVYGNLLAPGGGLSFIRCSTPGIMEMVDNTLADFNRINLGGSGVSEPAIKKNGSGISLRTATDSANVSLTAKDYTSDNLSSGTLTTARPIKFGDRGSITEAGFVALNLTRQIAIEHNGVVYYIPVSQTLIP